jgi:hypothetical protein
MREHALFRFFFDALAVAGACAEWGLGCWFAAPLGVSVPPVAHVVGPLVLAAANRIAARTFEREPAPGPLGGRGGRFVLACAFGALACAVGLGAAAGAWSMMRLVLGGFQAEAGLVMGGAAEGFFGGGFRTLGTSAIAASALAVAYGYAHGHRRLVVTRIEVVIPGLAAALAGLRVVQVSDLHLGPLADRRALRDALAQVTALDPDIVCITGDIVDSPATDLASWLPELTALRARHGVFAILGNHDEHVGADRVAGALGRWTSVRVLRDEVATLAFGDARLHLAGLEYRVEAPARAALAEVVARVPPDEPMLLLAHHPNLFPAAAAAGVPLTLSGHTHGGQVAVPGAPWINPARLLVTRWYAGTYVHDRSTLHVNRGLGTSGQRVRVGAPREITVVTLVAAAAVRAA